MGDPDGPASDRKPGLARLREALAARDWVGVAIEIGVVTLGILLAFQIDQYGDRRAQAKEERQFLNRLHGEYRRGIEELRSVNAVHDKAMRDIRLAMAARGDPDQLKLYSRQEGFGCFTTRPPTAPFSDSAYEDLLSSGRLNLISDTGLRNDVRDLATAQAEARTQWNIAREIVTVQLTTLDPYFRFSIDRSGKTECRVDWAALLQDPLATNLTIRAYRIHERVRGARGRVQAQMERLRGELGCKLTSAECRPATSPPS